MNWGDDFEQRLKGKSLFSLAVVLLMAVTACSVSKDPLAELEAELGTLDPMADFTPGAQPTLSLEKVDLKLGFIKLTDCAPLVIAKEKGFFEEEGLNVELEAQSNWKVLLDRVIDGQLDGAHMLAGQPIGAAIGLGTTVPLITGFSHGYNGNAITVSNRVWGEMQSRDPALNSPTPKHPISAQSLKPIVERFKSEGGRPFPMAMVFPVSGHNYELRYWLAAANIHPGMYTREDSHGYADADVQLSVTPPPQMPGTLEAGTIEGFCVGEPWNQQAVVKGVGVPVTTSYDIWRNKPEKVFGVTKKWNDNHPNSHIALVKALIRAAKWLDAVDPSGKFLHRDEAAEILSRSNYVGADKTVIANSMTGVFVFQKTDVRQIPEFNVFFEHHASYPHYSDCIWFLTQMRRWGQIPDAKPADWYSATAREVYKPEIYWIAAQMLVSEGKADPSDFPQQGYDGYRSRTNEFIDGKTYDARDPIGYLKSFSIGNRE